MTKRKPLAVLISDIHFNLKTRLIAARALNSALVEAENLKVPLIVAGDLHDTKAILRAECIKTIVDILGGAQAPVKVLVGNHDKIHEKSEAHALEFLRPYVDLIDKPYYDEELKLGFIPYQCTNEAFTDALSRFQPGDTLVVHQGFKGAFMGEYVKDESSVHPDEVRDFRIISGHYHRHQDLETITYIGTPYTTTFAEANDGPKGFVVLNSDGSIEKVPTDLRKHVIIETTTDMLDEADLHGADPFTIPAKDDLIWLKVKGPSVALDKLDKRRIGIELVGHQNFKFDKIPTDTESIGLDTDKLTDEEVLDTIIDLDTMPAEDKLNLKQLWRELLK